MLESRIKLEEMRGKQDALSIRHETVRGLTPTLKVTVLDIGIVIF